MPEVRCINRFFQFAYPIFIFLLSALLTWKSIGQVDGSTGFYTPNFETNHSKLNFLEAPSCTEASSRPWKLIETNKTTDCAVVKAAEKGVSFSPQ